MASARLLQSADVNRSLGSGLTHRSGNARTAGDVNIHSSTLYSPPKQCTDAKSMLPQPTSRIFLKPRRSAVGLSSKQPQTYSNGPSRMSNSPPRTGGQRSRRTRRPSRSRASFVGAQESGNGDRNYVRSSRVSPTRSSAGPVTSEAVHRFAPRSPSSFLVAVPAVSNSKANFKEISPQRPSRKKVSPSSTVVTPQRMSNQAGMTPIFESSVTAAAEPRKHFNTMQVVAAENDDKENISPSVQAAAARHARSRSHSRTKATRMSYRDKAPPPLRLVDIKTEKEATAAVALDNTSQSSSLIVNNYRLPHDVKTEIRDAEITEAAPNLLLPHRTSIQSVAPKRKKKDGLNFAKKVALPRLPTQIIQHTPKAIAPKVSDPLHAEESPTVARLGRLTPGGFPSLRSQLFKRAPRLSALRSEISGLSVSISSLGSAITALPTQILKHTPVQQTTKSERTTAQVTSSASHSPCISKGRAKSIWTMADEIALVRAGGMLPSPKILAPCPDAHVVALCLRRRNGVEAANQDDKILQTPRRSSSIPAHLHSSRRHSSVVSIEGSGRHGLPLPERALDLAALEETQEAAKHVERYRWTVVSVKNSEQDEGRGNGSGHLLHRNGYGVYVGAAGAKPSLMTRAQTYVRFKFLGSRPFASKKLVGRGDSRF